MDGYYAEYLSQVGDALDDQSSLGRLSEWLEKHTRLAGAPYSFRGHECHRALVDSTHHNFGCIKPSQMGVTELSIRSMLAFLATQSASTGLYLLPTVGEAQRMTKSRFDPVLTGSKYLKSQINPGSDSSSFKQIGDSQLFTGGTYGKAIISIPVDYLCVDELDFSNPENVATAESRLTHSRFRFESGGVEVRGIKRRWSTPTAKGYGVDKFFAASDQRSRLVRCPHCGHWFWPDFLRHVAVNGWDRPMDEMTYLDAQNLDYRGLLDTARLLCEKCRGVVKREDLGPHNREWVAAFPSRAAQEGWRLTPFDLPDYHTPSSILRKLIDYGPNTGHFRNFVLGQAYSDATNSVVEEAVEKATVLAPVPPDVAAAGGFGGMVAGLDVGKTSWLLVGKPMPDGGIDVVWAEQLRLRSPDGGDLREAVVNRLRAFRVCVLVCDAMPYTDTILGIQSEQPEGWVVPNFYSLRDKKLPMWVLNDKEWSVASHRTKTLDFTVKQVNSGKFRWPRMDEMGTVRRHLQGMKRIDRVLENGEQESDWVKSGDDHYLHAANYLQIAAQLFEADSGGGWAPMPDLHEVVVGGTAETD